ncbi:ABC transporter ATP-binding protein [Rhodococcus sp. NPDC060176]|uniref:ABC transporter ATP-binding protein n=1 Tax=Rhodococcus sp. NPDC060176 TaxID=3347062 RepID=UPI003661310D
MTSLDTAPLLTVRDLIIESNAGRIIIPGVSFDLHRGETLGLVGESGSGKTTTALALMGYARPGMSIVSGSVSIAGQNVPLNDEYAARNIRGRMISHVPQDPGTNLNPSLRISGNITDVLRQHGRSAGDEDVLQALRRVDLPTENNFASRFPHQLSGGQQQRVLITNSLACQPPLVVLDEPTTGLDVVTQAKVLDEIQRLRREEEIAMIYVSHDLAVVSQICDRIAVMYHGRILEIGSAAQVLGDPQHEYTRRLVAATPDHRRPRKADRTVTRNRPVLSVDHLRAVHKSRSGTYVAAQDISFDVHRGECVALVGESGSGKTTIARTIAGLHASTAGRITLNGAVLPTTAAKRTREQRQRVQIVFQNPYESLNPRQSIVSEVSRPAVMLHGLTSADARKETLTLLDQVRLPARVADKLPTELSGGERQRVAIARALAARPDVLICDEITSALDVSVQAAVNDLLNELRTTLGLALVFITHSLGVVATIADRVLVLESGNLCESGYVEDVFANPTSDRTASMLKAAPTLAFVGSARSHDGFDVAQ